MTEERLRLLEARCDSGEMLWREVPETLIEIRRCWRLIEDLERERASLIRGGQRSA